MMMLIHKICIAFNGLGLSAIVAIATNDSAAMLLLYEFHLFAELMYCIFTCLIEIERNCEYCNRCLCPLQ